MHVIIVKRNFEANFPKTNQETKKKKKINSSLWFIQKKTFLIATNLFIYHRKIQQIKNLLFIMVEKQDCQGRRGKF